MKENSYKNNTDYADKKHIADYDILEQIGETLHSIVYRARKQGESQSVIIKTLRNDYPSPVEIARLKHEYELIRSINIDGVIKVFDVIDDDEGVTLVIEDFGGVSLKEIIQDGIKIERFLDIGIRLAEILGMLHQGNPTETSNPATYS